MILAAMCGRYVLKRSVDELRAIFEVLGALPNWEPSWNIAPTQNAPVIRRHPETGERRLDLLRWGLVPHFITDPAASRQPINARSETAATTPMFRDALARRRGIVPIDAFYEWSGEAKSKQAWAVERADGEIMALAGLWEGWRGRDGTVLRTFTVLTTAACVALEHLHHRMPVVLERPDWAAWLGEVAGDLPHLLRPSEAAFRAWKVSPRVGNVRNNDPSLMEPA